MKITLIANLNGTLIGLSYESGKDITIGREIGNTIAPLSADGLSRHHARIFSKPDGWYVADLGSTNGSYRMGQKIEAPVKLEQRDMLQFGKLEVSVDEFSLEPDAAPVAAAAPAPAPAAPAPAPAAPAPTPAAPAAVSPLQPIAPAVPAAPVVPAPAKTELAPPSSLTPAQAAAAGAAADAKAVETARRSTLPIRPGAPRPVPAIHRPTIGGGLKPGLKMPPKPTLPTGLKLPPKPGLATGLKLPPKPTMPTNLKTPQKGVVRVATNPTVSQTAKVEPVVELKPIDSSDPVAELTPVE